MSKCDFKLNFDGQYFHPPFKKHICLMSDTHISKGSDLFLTNY